MKNKTKKSTCDCNCFDQQAADPSRRDFIRKASTLTLIGGSAFILEACGGGGSPTSSGGDTGDGGNTGGGGDTGGGGNNGGGNNVVALAIQATTMMHQLELSRLISPKFIKRFKL